MTIAKFEIENTFSTGKEGFDPEQEAFEQKINVVRIEAHKAGFQEGHKQALEEIEAKAAEALGSLQTALTTLYEDRITVEKNLEVQSVQLAHLIAKKIATGLIKKHPNEEIEKLIKESLAAGYKEPKIIIRISTELLEPVTSKLEEMIKTSGFLGEVQILGDESFSIFDCSIEWPNGGVSRNLASLEKLIQGKVESYINGPLEDVAVQSVEEGLAEDEEAEEAEEEEGIVEDEEVLAVDEQAEDEEIETSEETNEVETSDDEVETVKEDEVATIEEEQE